MGILSNYFDLNKSIFEQENKNLNLPKSPPMDEDLPGKRIDDTQIIHPQESPPLDDTLFEKSIHPSPEPTGKSTEVRINETLDIEIKDANLKTKSKLSIAEQLFMYLGIVIGILFSTYVSQFKSGDEFVIQFKWNAIIVSLIIGLILIPTVYEKLKIRSDSPFIVRFGLFVQNGVFWQVIVGSIGKTIGA